MEILKMIFYPFILLAKVLGFYSEPDLRMRYRVVITPVAGVSAKDLVATGKKIWPQEKANMHEYVNAWITAVKDGDWWRGGHIFSMEGLLEEDVKAVVDRCQKSGHFKVTFNEFERMKGMAEKEARRQIKKTTFDDLIDDAVFALHAEGELDKHYKQHGGEAY